ncbi:MAG: glycosyltransferase family 4 protein [Thermus sp.]
MTRVLWVLEASGGGAGRHVADLAPLLLREGVEVHLAYSPLRLAEPLRSALPALEEAGVRLFPLPMRRAPHPSDTSALLRLLAYARKEGPFALVHGHSSKGGALARLLGPLLGVPVIYTPHAPITLSPFLLPWERRLYELGEKVLARFTRFAVAVSPWEREELLRLGYPEERVVLIPNGVDPSFYSQGAREAARRSLELEGEFVIGFVGRLDLQKKPLLALEAFAHFLEGGGEGILLFMGEGPLGEEVEALARRRGLGRRVRFVSGKDTRFLIPALDLLLLTSAYEGMPYVLLEAFAAGVPVASAPTPGLGEWLGGEGLALVAEAPTPEALAAALLQAQQDPRRRASLRARGRAWTEERNLERMLRETLSLYRDLLRKSALAP